MILKTLSLVNYKNFESQVFEFDSKINCFVGKNGIGKTNALDAIYHLSFGKSYFNPISSQNIRHEQDFFVIEGLYKKDDKDEKVNVSLKRGQKKMIRRNGKDYERFSDHIGQLPLVIVSPSDRDLITEGSDTRRKFMDSVISQNDRNYLQNLISYNKVVSQRNALLKYFAANSTFDQDSLDAYNHQLVSFGQPIFEKRKDFIETFIPIFRRQYETISNKNEVVNLRYKSQLFHDDFDQMLKDNLARDKVLQYSSVGIHKDDLLFDIEEFTIKKFGSQGQQKSFLIALKLAQFEFIKQQFGFAPILLFDDIFDKLDEERVAQIINLVDSDDFGQIFISDTHAERTEKVIKKVHQTYKVFELDSL